MCEFFAVVFSNQKNDFCFFLASTIPYTTLQSMMNAKLSQQMVRALPRQLPDGSIDIAYASFKSDSF